LKCRSCDPAHAQVEKMFSSEAAITIKQNKKKWRRDIYAIKG